MRRAIGRLFQRSLCLAIINNIFKYFSIDTRYIILFTVFKAAIRYLCIIFYVTYFM